VQILQGKIALAREQVWDVSGVGFNVSDEMNTFFLLVRTYLLFFSFSPFINWS